MLIGKSFQRCIHGVFQGLRNYTAVLFGSNNKSLFVENWWNAYIFAINPFNPLNDYQGIDDGLLATSKHCLPS